ncbi:hypothetical protein [Stigmatella aurantiaca]|uniref:Conserved uncharacterized protein n=1 Tax=Stigmatella aurantiaca (strain DW4/3-1) TaxID=378806 RepID=Q092L4_STIAD|nr:hypothetical protein [Stigmatella aurantiaca]ADO74226.1 conserved uncharacterized protein [Stigmatella aurantiaca DW4/3-1]EAU66675.1 hypothetical protein STIAU_7843 [Stigmatella aurantiaca DW4/3-1]
MSLRAPLAPLFLTAALVGGCPKEEAPVPEDRTLSKLRAEVDRVGRGGPPSGPPGAASAPEDPNATLAGLASGQEYTQKRKLHPPEPNDTVHVGTVAVKLMGLEASHGVQGSGKVALTTEELFLRVQLIAQNVGATATPLALDRAKLVDPAGQEHSVARDVQIVAGTRELQRTWSPEERSEIILFFEVPPSALGAGLTLVLPSTSGDVRLALQ